MRRLLTRLVFVLAIVACASRVWAQASLGLPPVINTPTSGLTVAYTSGIVNLGGGPPITIPSGTVTLVDNQTVCVGSYSACNIVYVNGGTLTVATTSSIPTAYTAGNFVIAFVTTSGGKVTNIVSSTSPQIVGGTPPPGFTVASSGLRLPLCTAVLQQGCQAAIKTLSGF